MARVMMPVTVEIPAGKGSAALQNALQLVAQAMARLQTDMRQQMHDELHQQVQEALHQKMPEVMRQQIKEQLRQLRQEDLRQQMPENVRQQMQEALRQQMQQELREQLQEALRQQMPEIMDQQMKEVLRKQMQEAFNRQEQHIQKTLGTQVQDSKARLSKIEDALKHRGEQTGETAKKPLRESESKNTKSVTSNGRLLKSKANNSLPQSTAHGTGDGMMEQLEQRMAKLERSVEGTLSHVFPRVEVPIAHLEAANSQPPKGPAPPSIPIACCPSTTASRPSSPSVARPSSATASPSSSSSPPSPSSSTHGLPPSTSRPSPPSIARPTSATASATSSSSSPSSPSTSGSSSASGPRPPTPSQPSPSNNPRLVTDPLRRDALGEELNKAVNDGRLAVARRLLDGGADVNYANSSGKTPLMSAAYHGLASFVSLLLQMGADVHATGSSGRTALHCAARNDHSGRCVSLLVNAGATVGCRDGAGWTPLHCAVIAGNEEAIRALLRAGASTAVKDNFGKTPVDVATCDSIRKFLRQRIPRESGRPGQNCTTQPARVDILNVIQDLA